MVPKAFLWENHFFLFFKDLKGTDRFTRSVCLEAAWLNRPWLGHEMLEETKI
jgi:hypothetical protein